MRIAFVLGLAGCTFSPSLDGVFRCGTDGVCPAGLVCAADGVCRAVSVTDASPPARGPGPTDMAKPRSDDDRADMAKPPQDDEHDLSVAADLSSSPPDLATPSDLAMCVPATCSDGICGELLDGCGRKINCGDCHGAEMMCGAGGPNRCGKGMCEPITCKSVGADCGLLSDSCAHVLDCGKCAGGLSCTQNHCS